MKISCFVFLLLFLFISLNFTCSAQTADLNKEELQLLKATLETALISEKNLPDYNSLPNKNEIWLLDKMVSIDNVEKSAVYLTQKQVPTFKELKIKLVAEAELKDTARQEDILVVQLGQFKLPEDKEQPAIIYILTQWALGKESKSKGFVHKQAYGCAMGFKRTKKGWEYLKTFYAFINENR